MLPAHGPVLPALDAVARAYRDHRQGRLEQIRAALAALGADAGASFDADVSAVTDAVYADVDPSVRRAAELSVAAQLDYLRTHPSSSQQRPFSGLITASAASQLGGERAGNGRVGTMRIARFVVDSDPLYGIVEGEPGSEEVTVIKGDPFFHGVERTPMKHKLEDVRLLAPIIPRSKVIGVGRNFAEHARELGNEVPAQPLLFLKPNTSVIGPNDPIVLPEFSEDVSFEAELCVVIGRICKDVPENRVDDVIFGYTCGNDLTARDVQKTDLQWATGQGLRHFGPARARGSRPSSTPRTCRSRAGSMANCARTAARTR